MKPKPVIPREQAVRDIDDAVDDYQREAGERANPRLHRGPRAGLAAHRPLSGDRIVARYAHEPDFPRLASCPLQRYPYMVFFVERDHIDVWRVLHARRDIPGRMHESQDR